MIKLTLTDEQARIVSIACEFYARIRMGQFQEIIYSCINDKSEKDYELLQKTALDFRKLLYPDLDGAGHSYGIGKYEFADKAFDVHQVIRWEMSNKNTPYDREPFSYYPLPKCEYIKGE